MAPKRKSASISVGSKVNQPIPVASSPPAPAHPVPASAPIAHVGSWNGMTLDQWQMSDEHRAWALNAFRDPFFRDLIAVMQNTARKLAPRRESYRADIDAGRVIGHNEILTVITEKLTMLPMRLPDPVPEEYPPPSAETYDANQTLF